MDENKNNEMSVDELLEKLRESLQTEEDVKKPSADKVDDEDIKKAVAAAIGTDGDTDAETVTDAISGTDDEIEEPQEELFEEAAEPILEDDMAATIEMPIPSSVEAAEETEEKEVSAHISDEDIFAAWGVDKVEPVKKEEIAEEIKEEYASPDAKKTKVYYISLVESKEDYLMRKQAESQKKATDYDRVDCSLIKQALGMEKTEEADFPIFEVDNNSMPKTIDSPRAEFTYQRQSEDIRDGYIAQKRTSLIKLIITGVFALLLFVIECLPSVGMALPSFLSVKNYPVVYSMATIQLVWICGAISYKEIANGFLSMLRFRITSGSLLAISVLSCTICGAVCCLLGSSATVYHFSAAFLALVIRTFDYLDIRREYLAFDVASSTQGKKYVALPVPPEQISHIESLDDYTGDDSLILRTEKCAFVENYFARSSKQSDRDVAVNKYIVPFMVAVSVISLIIMLAKDAGAALAVSAFSMALAVGLPILALLSSTYPLYKATKRLYRRESAILGESAVDEYSGTTMICFDDADAFPSYGVALENLRIYGNSDIETIIEQMGAVFSKLGGPLKNVFALMTTDCPKPYKVKIDDVLEDGIKATVDGRTLFVGNNAYMEANGYNVVDKSNEIGGKYFSTMYLADEDGLRAKFYIRYTLDGSFETLVKKLARRGIASVILTGDSNINDELLARSLDISKLPVKVIRRSDFESAPVNDRADSGVVSRGTVGDLAYAVVMCDRLAGVINTMRAVRIASVVICTLLALAISALKMTTTISSLYVLVYHLFWMIPSWLVAKINL